MRCTQYSEYDLASLEYIQIWQDPTNEQSRMSEEKEKRKKLCRESNLLNNFHHQLSE